MRAGVSTDDATVPQQWNQKISYSELTDISQQLAAMTSIVATVATWGLDAQHL